jgi:hypothetical protein
LVAVWSVTAVSKSNCHFDYILVFHFSGKYSAIIIDIPLRGHIFRSKFHRSCTDSVTVSFFAL